MSDFDRSGYAVEWFEGADYAVVIREADDVGIGAYHSDELINEAINNDRAYLAKVDEETVNEPDPVQTEDMDQSMTISVPE